MIEPISRYTEQITHPSEPPRYVPQIKEACTIQSLNPVNWMSSFFSGLFRLLKAIFCCGCCRRGQSLGKGENIPEIDPRILSSGDPFRNEVFTFDSSGNFSFRFQKAFEKTSTLFRFLGTHGYWSWISHIFSLTAQEKEVKKFDSPPLTFLYYIFCNKAHTAHVIHFKEQAIKGKWILQLNTGRDPWNEFLRQQEKQFNKKGEILEKLPGFCKALGLEEKPIRELANEKKWRELIISVFEERKKYFKL